MSRAPTPDLTDEQRANLASAHDLLELAYQYVSDLRYPPTGDSVQRRIERAEAVIAKATAFADALAALNAETNEMVALSNGRLG